MPERENTPGTGRRFLLPLSSSTIKSSAIPSACRNPFQSARSAQIQPSSSLFTTTPRFEQSTPRTADEIKSSFENETDTPLPRRGSSFATKATFDAIDDDEGNAPISSLLGSAVDAEDDILGDNERSSPLQLRQGQSTYGSKRRKTTHMMSSTFEPITISSPSEIDELEGEDGHIGHSVDSLSDLDDDLGLPSASIAKEDATRFARFRPKISEPLSPLSKTVFKINPDTISPGQTAGGPVLPDIFSPSRRKGKRDYASGSNADLVRSWILAIPAQESQGQEMSEETISIDDAHCDSSGRFVVATDINGSRWLLPDQPENGRPGLSWSLSAVCRGCRIVVKGRATRWNLNLGTDKSNTVTVAAYWTVAEPG